MALEAMRREERAYVAHCPFLEAKGWYAILLVSWVGLVHEREEVRLGEEARSPGRKNVWPPGEDHPDV